MTQRRVTQEVVEADVTASVVQRRFTQLVVEADYIPQADRGITNMPLTLLTTPLTVASVPVSAVYYMRHVRITNTSSFPVKASVSIGADSIATRWLSNYTIAPNDVYDWQGEEVIPAGQIVQAVCDTGAVCIIETDGVLAT